LIYSVKAAEVVTDMNNDNTYSLSGIWSYHAVGAPLLDISINAEPGDEVNVNLYIDNADGKLKVSMSPDVGAPNGGTIAAYVEVHAWILAANSSETDTEDGVDYDYVGDGH